MFNFTSSCPNECLLRGTTRWETRDVCGVLADTRINFVSRWIRLMRAALASSSSSSFYNHIERKSSIFKTEAHTVKDIRSNGKRVSIGINDIKHTFCFRRTILSSLMSLSWETGLIPCLSCSSSSLSWRISFWYFLINDFSSIICIFYSVRNKVRTFSVDMHRENSCNYDLVLCGLNFDMLCTMGKF